MKTCEDVWKKCAKENKRERGALAVLTCHQNGAGTGQGGLRELEQEEARIEQVAQGPAGRREETVNLKTR